MDRELDEGETRRVRIRRIAAWSAGVGLVVAALALLPGWLRPSVARSRLITARVERGPVEQALSASGTVVPAFEQALSSPVEARVVGILKRPGEKVALGDPILTLDTSASRLDVDRLGDRLAQKRNEQEQLRLTLERSLIDLTGRIETKRLDAEVLAARAEHSRILSADGLVSAETLHAAVVEAKKAAIEVKQLEDSVASARRSTEAQLASLDLDLRMLDKDRGEARRQLELATTRSDRAGILTWVVPEVGATVRRGDVIARVADLDSFRVEATVSDIHSALLTAGLPVEVVLDGGPLTGRLASVHPAIENGTVRFTADLDAPRDKRLRDNQRVDVLVVTGARREVLRLRKGPSADADGQESVFVVRGHEAVRRPVRFGLSGAHQLEVISGLAEGDEVIVSEMKEFEHLDRIRLR